MTSILKTTKAKGGVRAMTQAERQMAIRDYISDKRETSIRELMTVFGVSRNTIRSDLDAITPHYFL